MTGYYICTVWHVPPPLICPMSCLLRAMNVLNALQEPYSYMPLIQKAVTQWRHRAHSKLHPTSALQPVVTVATPAMVLSSCVGDVLGSETVQNRVGDGRYRVEWLWGSDVIYRLQSTLKPVTTCLPYSGRAGISSQSIPPADGRAGRTYGSGNGCGAGGCCSVHVVSAVYLLLCAWPSPRLFVP